MKQTTAVERRFLARSSIDAEWLFRACDEIKKAGGNVDYFSGTLYLARGTTSRIEIEDESEWCNATRKHWSDISETVLWVSFRDLRFRISADHRRATVSLQVSAESEARCDALLNSLCAALDLNPLEADPYRYRRASAVYKIRKLNRGELADGLAEIIKDVAHHDDPPLREA